MFTIIGATVGWIVLIAVGCAVVAFGVLWYIGKMMSSTGVRKN